jgi:DNA modification methylase
MQLYNDDCLKVLPILPDKSIDLILTDPPYGTTACKWDSIIPFESMWKELKRVTKDNSCIALFGSEPFSSALRMSNIKHFKYDWIWKKSNIMGFLNAKKRPLKEIEIISIFNSKIYKPQNLKKNLKGKNRIGKNTDVLGKYNAINKSEFTNYPKTIIEFKNERGLHPTQKPIALLEYLIKTYTSENDIVLDFTMGSGSTGVACKNLNRQFIGIELDKNYFNIAKERIESTLL